MPPDSSLPDRSTVIDAARAVVRLAKRLEVALAETELTLAQYRVLLFLANGESRPSRIAPNVNVSRPTVTSLIDGLVGRGYVQRQPDDTDRRRVRHRVTPKGRAALAVSDCAAEAQLRSLAGRLDPVEATVALDSLRVWHDALDAAIAESQAAAEATASPSAAATTR